MKTLIWALISMLLAPLALIQGEGVISIKFIDRPQERVFNERTQQYEKRYQEIYYGPDGKRRKLKARAANREEAKKTKKREVYAVSERHSMGSVSAAALSRTRNGSGMAQATTP